MSRERQIQIATTAFVLVVTCVLATRLFHIIDQHAVNLLYYDQIDFYEAFKGDPSAWEIFRWQHGPHRQGIPFLGTWLIADWTDWDTRVDAFYVGSFVFAATGLAFWLRRRLHGPFTFSDIAIPLLLFTPAQYGTFIHTPNASHAAGPLFLLMCFCLVLTLDDRRWRYGLLVALDFLMVHTGFAVFAGGLTPLLLGFFAYRDMRRDGPSALVWPVCCLLVSLGWIVLFFVGYSSEGGVDIARALSGGALPLLRFVALMFANVLGQKGLGGIPVLVGSAVGLAAIAVVAHQIWRLFFPSPGSTDDSDHEASDQEASDHNAALVVLSLIGFSLFYCLTTALGRVHLGLPGAQSTRYVPLVAPAFLGLYLASFSIPRPPLRQAAGLLMVALLIGATFPMRPAEEQFMHRLSEGKRIWIESYLESGDIETADRAARIRIYPWRGPEYAIPERIEYLRAHGLNFFADRRANLDIRSPTLTPHQPTSR